MFSPIEAAAKALYEHWVEEDWPNEYCSWEQLRDQQTWIERATVALEAADAVRPGLPAGLADEALGETSKPLRAPD